ncbi:79_t:CDS:2, partial [Dentiscutata heterogama]
ADNLNRLNNCIDLNTSDLKPFFPENVPAKADQTIYLNVSFETDTSNVDRGVVNGSTYVVDVNNPTINQILFKNQTLFQPNQNVIGQFNTSQIIDIVVYNGVTGEHPFHLEVESMCLMSYEEAKEWVLELEEEINAKGKEIDGLNIGIEKLISKEKNISEVEIGRDNKIFVCYQQLAKLESTIDDFD